MADFLNNIWNLPGFYNEQINAMASLQKAEGEQHLLYDTIKMMFRIEMMMIMIVMSSARQRPSYHVLL